MSRSSKKKRGKGSEGLRLTNKKHPTGAIISTVLAVLSFGIFAVLCFMSGETNGKSGIEAGWMGILCLFISIVGFVLAWISLHQDNIRPAFPTIGAVSNGLMMLLYLMIYIVGTSL